ncbi:MAG: hypothetical protein ACYS7Y_27010 [Planctomycetota bacterium]
MAKVKIADVIEPSLFTDYVIELTTEKSRFFESGIVGPDARISERIQGEGGRTINMPFWNDLSGESEVLSDTTSLTPEKIDSAQDVATLNYRGKAWSANDLAGAVAGDDPMETIAQRTAAFWARDFQATLIAQLNGLFDATSGTLKDTHLNDQADEDGVGAGVAFSDDLFLDTVFLLGDEQESFQGLSIHSTIMKTMLKADLITFVKPSEQGVQIPTYRGRFIVVDDGMPKVAGSTSGYKYTTVIFGPGAIGYGEKPAAEPVEMDRDALAGDDVLVHRRHYVLHPRGIKWQGSPAGATPSNVEFATPANWDKVYQDKNIRIAALTTNS